MHAKKIRAIIQIVMAVFTVSICLLSNILLICSLWIMSEIPKSFLIESSIILLTGYLLSIFFMFYLGKEISDVECDVQNCTNKSTRKALVASSTQVGGIKTIVNVCDKHWEEITYGQRSYSVSCHVE